MPTASRESSGLRLMTAPRSHTTWHARGSPIPPRSPRLRAHATSGSNSASRHDGRGGEHPQETGGHGEPRVVVRPGTAKSWQYRRRRSRRHSRPRAAGGEWLELESGRSDHGEAAEATRSRGPRGDEQLQETGQLESPREVRLELCEWVQRARRVKPPIP